MRSEPASPPPADAADSMRRRRIYFEQLTKTLIASGVDGDRVGRLVAELDRHLADADADPVEELGPVGELAASLRGALGPSRLVSHLLGSLVFGVSFALALGTALPLLLPRPDADGSGIWLGLVIYMGAFSVGVALLWGVGGGSLRGRRTFEVPKPWFVVFAVATAAVFIMTQDLVWEVSTSTAVVILVTSVPVAAAALLWSIRRTRVRIPGNATHLRNLGWGPLGR
ncbi:MAG: hypothetical protein ACLFRV_07360 [Acidimicrobiales bacterium]